jgi:uncharacterized RDD family membrane protein YckC
MSKGAHVTETDRGYVSEESKRRFTLVAGVLGAVFFLAQTLLPMVLMFVIMMPMMVGQEFATLDVERAALWREELWLVQRRTKINWRDPENSAPRVALVHMRLTDLSTAGPPIPLEAGEADLYPALLPIGDRLWVIGMKTVAYYSGGALTQVNAPTRPPRASVPFAYGGRPALISLSPVPALATLQAEGPQAEWISRDLPLGLPPEAGSLRAVQAIEWSGRLYLFAQLCTSSPDHCSLSYRAVDQERWLPVVEEVCDCGSWRALVLESRPAVVLSEPGNKGRTRLTLVTLGPNGPTRGPIEVESARTISDWQPLSSGNRLLLVAQGMPGSLKIAEFAGGRISRSVRTPGSFPFGPNMMLIMTIPQLLPIVLSLVLAFVLTVQMRRHRVQEYAVGDDRRTFASLWQRALAQLVDLVPFVAVFLLPSVWMWRSFSDPETFVEEGRMFPLVFFGLFIAAFVFSLVILLAYSYFEGRSGKTPGKWLLGIRVLGTDLQPCGFRRAFVRNLLTFVDGFFSFLVGALLVALTENWQRLGDLAARTIVVSDAAPAGQA